MFTTSCFIRKNTPELRKKLENLGYKHLQDASGGWDEKGINKCRLLWTETDGCYWHGYIESEPKSFVKDHIDCGENEDLFLALAALREDTDKHQWFTDGTRWYRCPLRSHLMLLTHSNSEYERKLICYSKKATVEELIEHFTTNQ